MATCNNIILSQPEAGATLNHTIPDDVSARLNFGPQDISGLRLGGEGQLVISFTDGGQLNITNFDDLVDNGNLLYLEDGTLIDPSILTSALQTPANFNSIETAAGSATNAGAIKIAQPAANTTQEVTMQAGQKYICDFDPKNAATVEIKDGKMVLTFADGSQVIINDYSEVMAGELPAELTVADGTVIDGSELLTEATEMPSEEVLTLAKVPTETQAEPDAKQVANIEPAAGEDLAQQLANVEPAAGETGGVSNSGYGFNSTPGSDPFTDAFAIGPIGPTSLRYVAPDVKQENPLISQAPVDDRPILSANSLLLDETNLGISGTITATGNVNVSFGNDGPGTLEGNGNFAASCDLTGGKLSSAGVDVNVTFDALTNTYTGTSGATTVFTFVFDAQTGEYVYTQYEPFDHSDTTNDNEIICLDFGVTATDADGDKTPLNIRVNVRDDAPVVTSQIEKTVDETNFDVNGKVSTTGQFFSDPGEDTPVSYAGSNNFNATGSLDNGVLTSNGVPVTVTYDAATFTYTGTAGAFTVFTFVIDPTTGSYTYILSAPLDHADVNDPNDKIVLEFGMNVTDFDGDTKEGIVKINVLDDAPVISGDSESLDETDAFPTAVDGQVIADFGGDGAGVIRVNGDFSAIGSVDNGVLTSNGVPVDISVSAVPGVTSYVGSAGGVTIFTLTLNETTGKYDFVLLGPLDHADPNAANDIITLNFGVSATDYDGDSTKTTISIDVLDDVPSISNDSNKIDEKDLAAGPIVVNDTVPHDFGQDGAGEIFGNGDFQAKDQPNGAPITLTSGGNPVVVTFDAATNTYTGVSNGVTTFTLVIEKDGDYTFTLNQPIDHTNTTPGQEDVLWLKFGVDIADFDGDKDTAYIIIDVVDDVPSINPSSGDVDETNLDGGPLVYTGTINTTGDGPLTITPNGTTTPSTPLVSCGHPVTITNTNGIYTGTANGVVVFTLAINPTTGEYTYTQYQPLDHPDTTNPDDIISIDFGVNILESDGDTADTIITINIADDGPAATDDFNSAEEGQYITGDVRANDDLSQDGDDTGDNTVTNVTFNGTDYAVPANGSVTIVGNYGTLVMNSDGTYNYTANSNDPNGTDLFTYTLVDCDGDSATANLSIQVSPDGQPVAVSQLIAVDETNLTPGPMIFNGDLNVDFGLDGAGTVTPTTAGSFVASGSLAGGVLTSSGVPVVVTLSGNTYTGAAGATTIFTVTINNDGTYRFQLFDHIDHADATDPNDIITMQFGVEVTDADGDSVEGTFTVHVHDDAPVAYDDGAQPVLESQTVVGNVVTGVGGPNATADEQSEDNPTLVDDIIFNGVTTAVPTTGFATVVGVYGTLRISADGSYTYTANSNNPDGTDTFTYVLQDNDGDRDTAEFSFNVTPVDDVPVIVQPPIETVDDTTLATGPNVKTGTITVDYKGDGPGEVNPNGIFTHSENTLTACGNPITVTLSGNTYTGVANGVTIFTMTILENGNYTFTQFEAIDHANTLDPNDALTLNFGATATDADGDEASTTLRVRVLDDGPDIGEIAQEVQEDVLATGNLVATGTVPHTFGQDGPGVITTNGLFEAKFQMDGSAVTLTSGGNPITVTSTANGYTGTVNGQVAFTLTINPATGDYTYTQMKPIDHPDATDPDDVIWLKFYVDITDCDGDTDTGIIIIDVHDDGPNAVNDVVSLSRTAATATGNVLTNDDSGVDNSTVVVTTSGTYNGTYGTLVLSANGSYTYTRNGQAGGVDTFNYTMRDADGDTDTATLTVNVATDHNPIGITGTGTTDDSNVQGAASEVETGTITVNYQGDGAGSTAANGTFTSGGNRLGGALTSNGSAVTVTLSGNTYTGRSAAGETVFTMTINSNGTYRFEQFENLDHSIAGNNNEGLTLNFGVTATDADGDTGTGTVTITILDDGPDAVNDTATVSKTGTTATGNVLTNDDTGADDGSNVRVTTPGTYNGTYGTLVLSANGAYTYTRNGATGGVDTFNYTMRDHDGDTDTATLTVNVGENKSPIGISGTGTTDDSNVQGAASEVETGTITVNYQGDGAGSTAANGTFTSGGNRLGGALTSNGSAVTVTLSGNTYTGRSAAGETVFTMTINSNGTYRFEQFENLDHSIVGNNNEGLVLNFGVTATDAEGDTGTGTVTITVLDDGPDAVNDTATVSKTGTTATGNVLTNDDTGADDGSNVRVTTPGTYNGTYGTLVLSANGAYTYTRNGATGGVDTFNYTMRDHDGDTDTATLTVNVGENKSPIGITGTGTTDDTNVKGAASQSISGNISVNYQGDGPGTTTANGTFSSGGNQLGSLSSNGSNVAVTLSGNTYTGRSTAGETVFTMTINSNGTYNFVQYENLDHSIAGNNNEGLTLNFGVTARDAQGDTGTGTVTITVLDDGPDAVNDTASVSSTGSTATGNVLSNDNTGADDGSNVRVTTAGNYNGTYGSLSLSANGTYTYTRYGITGGTDTFNYTMRDHDGDTDTATLTVSVASGRPNYTPIGISGSGTTDDTNVRGTASQAISGTINVNYQGDGPGTTSANGYFTSGGNQLGALSSNGYNVAVTLSGNTYTGRSTAGETVFTMTINSNGTYNFVQYENLDHSVAGNNNESLQLNFGVTARDAQGDTGSGLINITVLDDGPTAVDDRMTSANQISAYVYRGSLLANDTIGADDAFTITRGVGTYDIAHGQLFVWADGTYQLNLNPAVVFGHNYELTYTIQDADGDTSTAILRFYVTPLVLDLDGDGIELNDAEYGVMFDYDNDGELEQTGWVGSDDGFLVQDRNGDGIINDRSEMFGDMFGHMDGFSHLGSLDTNGDGEITSADAEWADLQVWRDLNQDGVSDANELFSLDDLGIASINVGDAQATDQEIGNNYISRTSTYTTTDGTIHEIADVHFEYEDEDVDLSQYLVSGSDDIISAAIIEAAATPEVVQALNNMSDEDVFFVDQGDSVDAAIQDFVFSTTEETVVDVAINDNNPVDNTPLGTAPTVEQEIVKSEIIV